MNKDLGFMSIIIAIVTTIMFFTLRLNKTNEMLSDALVKNEKDLEILKNYYLNSSVNLVINEKDSIVTLIRKMSSRNMALIYVFSENDCFRCIKDQIIEVLRKNPETIIITDNKLRSLKAKLSNEGLSMNNIYCINSDFLKQYFVRTPLLFLCKLQDNEISNVFYPIKNYNELLVSYLENVEP